MLKPPSGGLVGSEVEGGVSAPTGASSGLGDLVGSEGASWIPPEEAPMGLGDGGSIGARRRAVAACSDGLKAPAGAYGTAMVASAEHIGDYSEYGLVHSPVSAPTRPSSLFSASDLSSSGSGKESALDRL